MTSQTGYRTEIDGLRAIAVASVIANHIHRPLMPSGHLGVDIFFVLSGYVITLSLCRADPRRPAAFLLAFYARRFRRILPALLLCVLGTAVLIGLVNPDPAKSLKTGIAALFGLSNLSLLWQANDYFGESSQLNAFTHTWSLGVEEQFYLLFPLLLWWRLRPGGGRRHRPFAVAMIAASLVSLLLFVRIGIDRPMTAFYLMPLRFWELAAGCLIALHHHRRDRPETPRSAAWRSSETLLPLLLVATLFAPPAHALAATIAVVALTAGALLLLSARSPAGRLLTSRPFVRVGLLSYSLYLWHWPMLVIGRHTVGIHPWSVPILLGATVAAAAFSYHLVERPLRTRRWARSNGGTVALGGAATIAAAVMLALLARPLDGLFYTGRLPLMAARTIESLADPYRIAGTRHRWAGAACILRTDAEAGKAIPRDACTLGHFDTATRRVLVLGNSYAAAFVQGFDALVRDEGQAVTITASWGASPIREVPNRSFWSAINTHYWTAIVPELLSGLRAGDRVLLLSDLSTLAPAQATPRSRADLRSFDRGLRRFSGELRRSGIRLAVLDVTPFLRESGCRPESAIPQWFAPGGGPCRYLSRAATLARRQPVHAVLRRLRQEGRIDLVDLFDLYCPGPACTFRGAGGLILYRDEFSHPSVEAVRRSAPVFHRLLTAARE